nr:hypothetical protein Iba_chr07aCG1100 [Ipomoea batatas]
MILHDGRILFLLIENTTARSTEAPSPRRIEGCCCTPTAPSTAVSALVARRAAVVPVVAPAHVVPVHVVPVGGVPVHAVLDGCFPGFVPSFRPGRTSASNRFQSSGVSPAQIAGIAENTGDEGGVGVGRQEEASGLDDVAEDMGAAALELLVVGVPELGDAALGLDADGGLEGVDLAELTLVGALLEALPRKAATEEHHKGEGERKQSRRSRHFFVESLEECN